GLAYADRTQKTLSLDQFAQRLILHTAIRHNPDLQRFGSGRRPGGGLGERSSGKLQNVAAADHNSFTLNHEGSCTTVRLPKTCLEPFSTKHAYGIRCEAHIGYLLVRQHLTLGPHIKV